MPSSRIARWLPAMCAVALAANAHAGADNAKLDCKSPGHAAEQVRLHGEIPGDLADFSLTLEFDGVGHAMAQPDDTIDVITELGKGVFTLAVERRDHGDLRMYAVPRSVKLKGGSRRLFDARFEAVLMSAPKPGVPDPVMADALLRDVRLLCTLHHRVTEDPVDPQVRVDSMR